MIGGAILGRIGKGLAAVLAFGVTIPVGLMLAAGIWLYVDRASALRHAVDRAVTDLVAGEELAAERAKNEALNRIILEKNRLIEADRAALARFSDLLAAAQTEKEGLADELAELEASPPPDACVVDRALLDRLRK